MFETEAVHELLAYRPPTPVLSVYLDLDPQRSTEALRLELQRMLEPYELEAPGDVGVVRRHVEANPARAGRSLALFSRHDGDFFRALPLSVPVRNRARLLDRPYVKPLADLLDRFGHYGVAAVDQQGARLFFFHLGELREQGGVEGEAVRHAKRGGASSFPGRRGGATGRTEHNRETADRNLRQAARAAAEFFRENKVRRVLIGGTPANVRRFRWFLPKSWLSLVVGEFPIDLEASPGEVLRRAMAVAEQAEARSEAELVESVVTAAAKGGDGVVRLDPTLQAVHEGRVMTLVVRDGFRAPGFRCARCGFLTARRPTGDCPYCGASFEEIGDAVELAVRRVWRDGGEVEFVGPKAGLEQAGSVGGRLRY
jgi:hypothetical protein